MAVCALHIDLNQPFGGDPGWEPTTGYVNVDLYQWQVEGVEVIVPASFDTPLVNGEATISVVQGWYYWINEGVRGGICRLVLIPLSATAEYADLPSIDPDTLDPIEPDPAWGAALAAEEAARIAADEDLQDQIDVITGSDVESVNGFTGVVTVTLVEDPPASFFYTLGTAGT